MTGLVVRARQVVLPDGVRAAAVHTVDGRIAAVTGYGDVLPRRVTLADDEVLLPGLVDSHVHVNEPGRTEWEGFATATAAAAAGRRHHDRRHAPELIPPTTSVQALHAKRAAAKGQLAVDVAFWGGAVPGNVDQLAPLLDAGVVGFKCFLLDSGVAEFPPLDDAGLRRGADRTRGRRRAADRARRGRRRDRRRAGRRTARATRLPGVPAARMAEESAIGRLLAAARDTGAPGARRAPGRCGCAADAAAARAEGCRSASRPARTTSPSPRRRCRTARPRSSAARRSARHANREALWAGLRRRRSTRGQRPLAVHARPQAARRGRFRRGLGRDRLAAGGAAGGVDRRPGTRDRAGPPSSAGWRRRPAAARRAAGQGRDRRGQGRRPGRLRARRALDRRPAGAPQPGDPVCRAAAGRRRPQDLAARAAGRRHARSAGCSTGDEAPAERPRCPSCSASKAFGSSSPPPAGSALPSAVSAGRCSTCSWRAPRGRRCRVWSSSPPGIGVRGSGPACHSDPR